MPEPVDSSCPFCGARLTSDHSACPACDLPLLGSGGEHPPTRSRVPFDGASLFEEAFPGEEFVPAHIAQPRLATERRSRDVGRLRCVVVAINQAEAEMLCDMLRAEGVPCMVRSPDLQSYAQTSLRCEVLVPESSLSAARELLRIEDSPLEHPSTGHLFTTGVLLAIVAVAVAVALLITYAN